MSIGIYIILFLLLLLLFIVLLYIYLSREVLNPLGKGAGKRTGRMLRSFAAPYKYKVLSDIYLPDDSGNTYIENLLIGSFGLLLVSTLGQRGEFYGQPDSKEWMVQQPKEKLHLQNPLIEQQEAIRRLRGIFSKEKLYKLPIYNLVYFSSKSTKTTVYISNTGELLFKRNLLSYLSDERFETDNNIDIAKIAQVIEAASTTANE